MLKCKQVIGGRRNVTLHITGMLSEGDLQLTSLDLDPERRLETGMLSRGKLANLLWIVQEKLVVLPYWTSDGNDDLIMPMESRNSVRLDPAIQAPKAWDGRLWFETLGWAMPAPNDKWFFIALDFDL